MEDTATVEQIAAAGEKPDKTPGEVPVRWKLPTRIGFRFAFVLFGLYIFPFPIYYIPWAGQYIMVIFTPYYKALNWLTPWTGKHILRINHELSQVMTGSGDTTYGWVSAFCILCLAIIATVTWSILDRRRPNYRKLYAWFAVFVRYSLAAAMFGYGLNKVFPNQMPHPLLTTLLEPYGNASPMGILWTFIGSSTAYEVFAGSVETIGGLLLIFPRTAGVGAMVSAAAMFQVWMLNMCYDVPVKLYSFQLFLEAVFLMLPYIPKLTDLLVFKRPIQPTEEAPLFKGKRASRIALAVQIVFGLYMFFNTAYSSYKGALTPGFGIWGPKPPLYGIWNADEVRIDGQVKPPLLTDDTRLRRIIFPFEDRITFQQMDEKMVGYAMTIDQDKHTIELKKRADPNWKADFTYQQPEPGKLVLDGEMDGHKLNATFQRFDESKFQLTNRGFHWIQEMPYNR